MTGWLGGLFGGSPPSEETFQKVSEGDELEMTLIEEVGDNLPNRHAQFVMAYVKAARKWSPPELNFVDYSLILAAIIDRESYAGYYLQPKGPEGTGDPTPRWFKADEIPKPFDELQDASLYTGETKEDAYGNTLVQCKPPAWAGATVPGWGYGLGQIDFMSFKEWLAGHDWKDPVINIGKAGELFSKNLASLNGDIGRAIAAYNAGVGRISRVQRGDDYDRFTTGGDYSSDVIARAQSFGLTRQV